MAEKVAGSIVLPTLAPGRRRKDGALGLRSLEPLQAIEHAVIAMGPAVLSDDPLIATAMNGAQFFTAHSDPTSGPPA